LRKVFWVQRDNEVSISVLGTITNVIVVRVRRKIVGRAGFDGFTLGPQRVDDFPDKRAADAKPGEHFPVLLQNLIADQPDEHPLFHPTLHELRTRNIPLVDPSFHSSDADKLDVSSTPLDLCGFCDNASLRLVHLGTAIFPNGTVKFLRRNVADPAKLLSKWPEIRLPVWPLLPPRQITI